MKKKKKENLFEKAMKGKLKPEFIGDKETKAFNKDYERRPPKYEP